MHKQTANTSGIVFFRLVPRAPCPSNGDIDGVHAVTGVMPVAQDRESGHGRCAGCLAVGQISTAFRRQPRRSDSTGSSAITRPQSRRRRHDRRGATAIGVWAAADEFEHAYIAPILLMEGHIMISSRVISFASLFKGTG